MKMPSACEYVWQQRISVQVDTEPKLLSPRADEQVIQEVLSITFCSSSVGHMLASAIAVDNT